MERLHIALTTSTAAELVDSADTHKDVHDPFNLRPGSQDHVHDVPVGTHEGAETNEAPVDGSNSYEDKSCHGDGILLCHRGKGGRNRKDLENSSMINRLRRLVI